MTQTAATIMFGAGLVTSTAALDTPAGALISGLNYEPLAEGYGRVEGYERYDGRPAASQEPFYVLGFDAGTAAIASGDTVTGGASGATGMLVAEPYGVSGAWGSGNAAGDLILVNISGTFIDNEAIKVGGVTRATANGVLVEGDSPNDAAYTTRVEAAMAWRRTTIGAVPGSGPVRGVAVHGGAVYAWRDNVGATALIGHRATASGWTALATVKRINFTSGGVTEIVEGDTITGATSAATALILRVVTTAGTWAAGTAAGYFYAATTTGAFVAENVNVGAAPNLATVVAAVTVSFNDGGRVRWLSHNFYGAADRYRLYGATGEASAFEIVSDAMIPASTGMDDDRPTYIFEIANHLGLCFRGGSVQISGTGEPLNWTPILGASEIGIGTEITDVVQANETAVALFGSQKIAMLTGHDVSDFTIDTLTEEAGAEADTAQRIARTVYIDKRGLRSLDATQAFGSFKAGAMSQHFEQYFKIKSRTGVTAIGSIVSRTKSQYRVYWSDNTGLAIYMGGKVAQAIPFSFAFTPFSFGQGELADGEAIFIGAEDGYVYRLDSGNNQDGEQITAVCMTPFNHFGSPIQEKRFHKVSLELQGPPAARIGITANFDYGDPNQPIDTGQDFTARAGGGFWDQALWDSFAWSDPVEGVAECYIDGLGRNANFAFATTAGLTEAPHTLQAYIVHFSPRKVKR